MQQEVSGDGRITNQTSQATTSTQQKGVDSSGGLAFVATPYSSILTFIARHKQSRKYFRCQKMRKFWWVWNLFSRLVPNSIGRGDAAAAVPGGNNFSRSGNTWISRYPTWRAGSGLGSARVVDLRSDAMTRPGPAMRRAMAEAECGDDLLKEDPVVNGEYFTL